MPPSPSSSSALSVGALVLAASALIVAVFTAAMPTHTSPAQRTAEGEAHEGELLEHMAYFQRYTEKLYLAGEAQNWPLAAFYAEEIESHLEGVVAGGFIEDGVDVSQLADSLLRPALRRVGRAVEAEDPAVFAPVYSGLVSTCNRCHQESRHPFVRITIPRGSDFSNQDFAPVGQDSTGR